MAPKSKKPAAPNKYSTLSPPEPPNWPPFKPLLPTSDLVLSTLIPNQIVTISQFFTSSLCKTYVSFLKTLPLVTTPGKPKKGDALRVNDRFQVMDERFANRLWEETGLRELVCGGDEEEAEGMMRGDLMSKEEREQMWYAIYHCVVV
jgi:hypothetical protein